ncbi:hypothetical protein DPMN_021627 [Dreissena polymorpha]|uniref:C2H2-type domain-containing protein n=1 Tax=Dreissena polymorpha TaxID=45954 RepID=A0A9D4NPB3_DREPO|nr:hypothetical protein DPMN_021627 [Dreissena polymorpha]
MTDFNQVLPDMTDNNQVLPDMTDFNQVLPDMTDFNQVLPDMTDFNHMKLVMSEAVSDEQNQNKQCPFCLKVVQSPSHCRRHVVVHTGDRPFKCHVCNRSFNVKTNLAALMVTHRGYVFMSVYPFSHHGFPCDICGHVFRLKHNLKQHMRIHTGYKPHKCTADDEVTDRQDGFPCDVCGHVFRQKYNLNQHMRIHTMNKPFRFPVLRDPPRAPRLSTRRCQIKPVGKRLHAEDKNTCAVCGRVFRQRSNLNQHMRIHTGCAEDANTCAICGHVFRLKSNLKQHMRIHTGCKPYTCEVCGKAFNRRNHLKTHALVHIGDIHNFIGYYLFGPRRSYGAVPVVPDAVPVVPGAAPVVAGPSR